MKLSLVLNDATFYVENPSESNGTLMKPLREFSEIAMFHIKNQLCFSTPIHFFWLRWVFVAAHGLSLVAVSRGYSSMRCTGFSLRWLLLLRSTGSRCAGFSSCGSRAQQLQLAGSRAQAQQLWRTGLVAPRHVGSSRTRAQTRVSCTGRRIIDHCATRDVPTPILNS